MKTPFLLDVPRDRPTRAQRLKAFKKMYQIETHYFAHLDLDEFPWMACHMPSARKLGYGVSAQDAMVEILFKVGRLADEAGITDYGKTEREAIRAVCENLGIPCDL